MRSELFLIPIEVYGVPLFGFGVLLLVWLAVVGCLLWSARKSPQTFAELVAQWPFFAIVAVVLVGLPYVFDKGLPIRGYGLMLVLGGITGLSMATYRGRRAGIDGESILSITMWMVIAGIASARIFYVIQYWQRDFAGLSVGDAVYHALDFTSGGLVVFGSIFGAAIAFIYFCRRNDLPLLATADILAPSLLAGLAIGRIGCLLHGCCFGGACDLPWAVTFPAHSPPFSDQLGHGELYGFRIDQIDGSVQVTHVGDELAVKVPGLDVGQVVEKLNGVPIESFESAAYAIQAAYAEQDPLTISFAGGQSVQIPAIPLRARSLRIHPTQIYSSINAALTAIFLWFVYRVRGRDGVVIGLALTLYPIARFLLEAIRTDEPGFLGTGLSISQNISLALLAVMPIYWYFILRQPRRQSMPREAPLV